jgi:hypothetical protein
MLAPTIWELLTNMSSTNFPNLDELLLRTVLAFPIASISGDEANTFLSTDEDFPPVPPTAAKYSMACLAETVFPAPDSPEMMTDWFRFSLQMK